MSITILAGDCRSVLTTLPNRSVHCCVTSPPYFGLRDYGVANQIGLEPTPADFVAEMVAVFREVRRVLRDDGTLWLNLGDSYASDTYGQGGSSKKQSSNQGTAHKLTEAERYRGIPDGLKKKDLIGIPWRVAFALQADGWYLRQDIIWHKPNPMPESVTDRCTKAHEYIFMLSKSPRYYFDAGAIKEPASGTEDRPQQRRAREIAVGAGFRQDHFDAIRACGATDAGKAQTTQAGTGKNAPAVQALADEAKAVLGGYYREFLMSPTKNKRSVWTVAPKPFKEAHFATFPPALIEPCILAGTSEGGVCARCGAPQLRIASRDAAQPDVAASDIDRYGNGETGVHRKVGGQYQKWLDANPKRTIGWKPSCECAVGTVPATVLDPFFGAGTTGIVARDNGRDCIGVELNPEYIAIAKRRLGDGELFSQVLEAVE